MNDAKPSFQNIGDIQQRYISITQNNYKLSIEGSDGRFFNAINSLPYKSLQSHVAALLT
jgi:hypothetical protein